MKKFRVAAILIFQCFLLQLVIGNEVQVLGQKTSGATLDTAGLNRASELDYIYNGRFNRIDPDSIETQISMIMYVKTYADHCYDTLSKNKVEIESLQTNYETEITTYLNKRGIPVGSVTSQRIKDRRWVGTGVYAEPEFANAYSKAQTKVGLLLSGQLVNQLANRQPVLLDENIDMFLNLQDDFYLLFKRHGCTGAATTQLGLNLLSLFYRQPSVQQKKGDLTYLEKVCIAKLPSMLNLAESSVSKNCSCVVSEFKQALPVQNIFQLEDDFSAGFFFLSVTKSGLNRKINSCVDLRK